MYLGNQPALSYTSFAKQDFTTSATTSYTLDNPVTNENEIALFINFVRQEPTTAYTASGTSLTLTSATSASDDMYCVFLGKAVQTVNPPNGSVGASQLADDAVTTAKILDANVSLAKLSATGTKDSTTFLRGDNTFAEAGGGIEVADQWRLTSDFTGSASPIASNLERVDTAGQGTIGTAMSVSSGVFTFPSTGVYLVNAQMEMDMNADCRYIILYIKSTRNNGGSWTEIAEATTFLQQTSSNYTPTQVSTSTLMSISDTSNHKVRFDVLPVESSLNFKGNTNDNESHFTFIRLGDV